MESSGSNHQSSGVGAVKSNTNSSKNIVKWTAEEVRSVVCFVCFL